MTTIDNNYGGATGQAASAGQKLAGDMQTFLKLLTTQLQHQDPMQPMDSKEFTQQLVAFSGVEQQITTNQNLEKLISQVNSQEMSSAVNFIGRDVQVLTTSSKLADGKASWSYALDLTADSNAITVKDATGNTVYKGSGETKAGAHQFTWDGKDMNGTQLPDGMYTLEIAPKTQNGTAVAHDIFMRGEVEGVEQVNGQYYLSVGGMLILPTQAQSIYSKAKLDATT
ncbi:flagellar hook assembly protein FlgD [Govanella unica]|uniref:Basal-body rod modification protein FlgD n=1 Tax=Govanella unica TaxID=2975056 RepID=A0A9X3TWI2_9PROT|nr:flagellar hook assembly protein FlgD [Govania unica]MDA5193019.1 flagellar hook assembly protein FlgD [Govania unica]